MKIAQVSHPGLRVPPEKYGGAELIIANLVNGLVEKGHEVTLFGTGDSKTKAQELVSFTPQPIGISVEDIISVDKRMIGALTLYKALEKESEFDIIHWHVSNDLMPVIMASFASHKSVVTFHNGFTSDRLEDFYKTFYKTSTYVSISDSSREIIPLNFTSTVYNGINLSEFEFSPKGDEDLIWLGRFSPVKGAHLALEVAEKLDKKIKIAAPNPQVPRQVEYYRAKIEPILNRDNVQYVGEIGASQKSEFLGKAKLLLNPISWHEAFGLVVAEANACGTPVIAFDQGSMREIIKDGVNGFLVPAGDVDEMTRMAKKIYEMVPSKYEKIRVSCRDFAEKNFSVEKMIEGYLSVYEKIVQGDR